MRKKNKLIQGVGINDADYEVRNSVNGKYVICPFYRTWANMLKRCYSAEYHIKRPTYKNCSVCEEWLKFTAFKKWMEAQRWQGMAMDKDLLFVDNKIYSPETCVFVDVRANSFMIDSGAARGNLPIGVHLDKRCGKFQSSCRNPFTGKRESLGLYDNPLCANNAWRKRKHELACQLADLQTDERVAAALRLRYA